MKRLRLPALLALLALIAGGAAARAVEPRLVADINPSTREKGSNPQDFVGLDGVTVFTAEDPAHGRELWASDDTAEGTHLIRDICPGPCPTYFRSVGRAGRRWYFHALPDPSLTGAVPPNVPGTGLWSTDGTREGTHFLADFGAVGLGYVESSGIFFFAAADAEHGFEPWRSDGTSGGTWRLGDLAPGPTSSITPGCASAAAPEDVLLFAAATPAEGCELWRSDGSFQGTALVRDIRPGKEGSYPLALVTVGDRVVFEAYDDRHGNELWRSDGTRAGTELVTEIAPGADSTIIGAATNRDLRSAGGRAYFLAATRTVVAAPSVSLPVYDLWQTDGTKAGTRRLTYFDSPTAFMHDIFDSDLDRYLSFRLAAVGPKVYFAADDGLTGWEPWVSDGTSAGTHRLADLCAGACGSEPLWLRAIGDQGVAFEATDETQGREIWFSDGTAGGTQIIADLFLVEGCETLLDDSAALGDRLILSLVPLGEDVIRSQLWTTGGTRATTGKLGEWPESLIRLEPSGVGGQLLFSVDDGEHGAELWATAGTPGSTRLLKDLVGQVGNGSRPGDFTPLGSRLFFRADGDGQLQDALWSTDGTAAGTQEVLGAPSPTCSTCGIGTSSLHAIGGLVYYEPDGVRRQLWRSDGTEAGTFELLETSRSLTGSFGELEGGEVAFSTEDGLWKTDGTAAGTEEVRAQGLDGQPYGFTRLGHALVFGVRDFPSARFWKTDGTAAGTEVVSPPDLSIDGGLLELDGRLYFSATQGDDDHDVWFTDGTEAGTRRATDLAPDGRSGGLHLLARLGGRLLFEAYTPDEGWALWSLGGTTGNLDLVLSLSASLDEYPPKERTVGRSRGRDVFYFQRDDGVHGLELWVTDGTAAGTALVKDIDPGSGPSAPASFATDESGTLFFTALEPTQGRQYWRTDGTARGTYAITSTSSGLVYSSAPGVDAAAVVGNLLLFVASDAAHGEELWSLPTNAGPAAPPEDPGAGVDPPPPAGAWLETPEIPGFRFKLRIAQGGGAPIPGAAEAACIPETLCVSGAVAGRSEVFVRVVGPKPNGKLWPTLVKFTTSEVEVWIEQLASGQVRYYRLAGASPGVDELPGLFDRGGFDP